MSSEAQVAPALAALPRPPGTAYWLQARTVRCPDCLERDQGLWECLLTDISSARYSPHDSGYLVAVGCRNRSEVPQHRRTLPARETTTLYAMVVEIVVASKRAA